MTSVLNEPGFMPVNIRVLEQRFKNQDLDQEQMIARYLDSLMPFPFA
jgi:hypothetical protein